MATTLPLPPYGTPLLDPRTGAMNKLWENYFLELETALVINAAPVNAQYWVSTSNADLTNERNIGALTTGYLKATVAAGTATPSTTATIPASDIGSGAALTSVNDTNVTLSLGGTPTTALLAATSLTLGWTGTLGLARGGTAASLAATGGASQVLRQSSVGGAVTVSQLTGTDIAHSVVTIDNGDTPYAVAATDETVLCDATLGAITVTLPTATSGRIVTVKKIDNSVNAITIDGDAGDIDGAGTQPLSAQWDALTMQADGTNWFITASV
jgi:hypothetical protein